MSEQEILDRLEVLRQKKLKLYFNFELLKKSTDPKAVKKFEGLKVEISEVKNEMGKLMTQKAQINLERKSQL